MTSLFSKLAHQGLFKCKSMGAFSRQLVNNITPETKFSELLPVVLQGIVVCELWKENCVSPSIENDLRNGKKKLSIAVGEGKEKTRPQLLQTKILNGKLNGRKNFVSAASSADLFLVLAVNQDRSKPTTRDQNSQMIPIDAVFVEKSQDHVFLENQIEVNDMVGVTHGPVVFKDAPIVGTLSNSSNGWNLCTIGIRRCEDLTLSALVLRRLGFEQQSELCLNALETRSIDDWIKAMDVASPLCENVPEAAVLLKVGLPLRKKLKEKHQHQHQNQHQSKL